MRSSGHVVLRPRYRRACGVVRGAAFDRRLVRGAALALRKGVTLDDADHAAVRGFLELRSGLVTRPGSPETPSDFPEKSGGLGDPRRKLDTATDAGFR